MEGNADIKRVDRVTEITNPSTTASSPTDKEFQHTDSPYSGTTTKNIPLGGNCCNVQGLRGALHRVGKHALLTLTVTIAVMLAIVGFFGFLWFGNETNAFWLSIMLSLPMKAVTFPSLVLRAAVDLQSSIVASMLASLALESGSILLRDAASVSTARADRTRPRRLLFQLARGQQWTSRCIPEAFNIGAIVLLCLTTLGLQFTSTILVSDLRLGQLPGLPYSSPVAYDFEYQSSDYAGLINGGWAGYYKTQFPLISRINTWQRPPFAYPAFAEYSEPVDSPEGVEDTGVLLRAFLPYADSVSRGNVRNYTGNALVMDARVSCQRPRLTNLSARVLRSDAQLLINALTGTFEPSIKTARQWSPEHAIPFNCTYFVGDETMSICQIQASADELLGPTAVLGNTAGGLISEFANTSDPSTLRNWAEGDEPAFVSWGTPLLVLNTSTSYVKMDSSIQYATNNFTDSTEYYYRMENDTTLSLIENGIYIDIVSQLAPVNLSISLCYSAWDSTRLDVELYSDANRSEPITHWTPESGYFTSPDLDEQLGNTHIQDALSRGVMHLARKDSWITKPDDAISVTVMPFIQSFAAMELVMGSSTNKMSGNWSAIWCTNATLAVQGQCASIVQIAIISGSLSPFISPDPAIMLNFRDFMASSGSLARSVSSLITVLSSAAYYDQMPQFRTTYNVTQVFFVNAVFPRSHNGFWAIVTLLSVHVAVVVAITFGFIGYSESTLLGNSWQSVAQLWSQETEALILSSSMATDTQVRERLRNAGMHNVRVKTGPLEEQNRIGMKTG